MAHWFSSRTGKGAHVPSQLLVAYIIVIANRRTGVVVDVDGVRAALQVELPFVQEVSEDMAAWNNRL